VQEVLKILDPGFGASIQDRGRTGWRHFGVPRSGVMDAHAAEWANRLVENPSDAPVIEFLFHGAKIEVLADCWLAFCGASVNSVLKPWRAYKATAGEMLTFKPAQAGVWSYLALSGGCVWPEIFGSASYYARAGLGKPLLRETILARGSASEFRLPAGVAGRVASWEDQRTYATVPRVRIWPGPQWKNFSMADREILLTSEWTVSSQSDRVGYRLEGPPLKPNPADILSEPVLIGSVQIPENGQPIVTMPDGPTVGGYPKIALVDPVFLPWLVQTRPGEKVRFELAT
jgi:biotin-dependent carboxylase-like uncharacterized protein